MFLNSTSMLYLRVNGNNIFTRLRFSSNIEPSFASLSLISDTDTSDGSLSAEQHQSSEKRRTY